MREKIEDGAYVQLEVKYGYIRLINTKADLCKEIKNVDLECPIEKGELSIIKSVDLPNEIPPVRSTPLDERCRVGMAANTTGTGQVHRQRGCLHQGRRTHYLLDCYCHVCQEIVGRNVRSLTVWATGRLCEGEAA